VREALYLTAFEYRLRIASEHEDILSRPRSRPVTDECRLDKHSLTVGMKGLQTADDPWRVLVQAQPFRASYT